MNSTIAAKPLAQIETPLLALALAAGSDVPASLAELDGAAGGVISRALKSGDFKGKRDETLVLYPAGGKAQRLLLVGLGKAADVARNGLRRAAAVAGKRARQLGAPALAFAVTAEGRNGVGARDLGQVVAEGASHGAWIFTQLKQASPDEPRPDVESVALVVDAKEQKDAEAGRQLGAAIAAGARLTRMLQMQPGNVCTPSYLADQAGQLGKTHGFTVTVLDLAAIKKEGMGALLGVSQGSQQEPRFMVLEYQGAAPTVAPLVLVGKGVTFDSGGISIKPAQSMEDMKYDMSGAAAVLGTFEVIGRLKPKLNVVGLIPATENLPSGTAVKPGDVLKSHLGKTIEIVNTDAEGRLILCDALSYARRHKPAAALDAATLTGAVSVALGSQAIGIMGNDDALVAEVREAGERAGERCWPLPLWEEYRDLVKSDIADVRNSGGRGAGTIAGGWFLREFVEGFPWVHLDIAGTAYTDAEGPHQVKGPTAIGVRLFTEFLLRRAGA
jgi:leucyl aminopeptidase